MRRDLQLEHKPGILQPPEQLGALGNLDAAVAQLLLKDLDALLDALAAHVLEHPDHDAQLVRLAVLPG